MGTSWKEKSVAEKFNLYNDVLENALGFQYLLKKIEEKDSINSVLDYGCGPGKMSIRIADSNERVQVIAVDESEEMIKIAREVRSKKNINYKIICNDNLYFINDNTIDCAIICFVFINNGKEERIRNIIKEVYRVLKKGGLLLILDSNPDVIGIQFSTFRNGDIGKQYYNGENKKQYLHIESKEDLVLNDYYWSREFYLEQLRDAGFSNINMAELKIDDLGDKERARVEEQYKIKEWGEERKTAPFIIFETIK